MSPLHWAAIKGNFRSVKALIRAGATSLLHVKDSVDKMTPEELATMKSGKAKFQNDKVRYLKLAAYLRGIEGFMHWRKHLGVTELYAKKGFFLGFGGFFTYWALFVLPFGFYLWYEYMMVRTSHMTFCTLFFVLSFSSSFMSGTWHHSWTLVISLLRKENKNYQRQDLSIYAKSIMRP